MNARVRFSGIAELAGGLSWRHDAGVLLAWLYYDESGEYKDGKLTGLTMGGVVSTAEKWCELERRWRAVLDEYGIPEFHMADFERWLKPFDFTLPDGSRDKVKHNNLLNALLDLMIEYVEGMHGYACTSILRDGDNAHREYIEDCVIGATKDAVLGTWQLYQEPLHLVFDRQNHFKDLKKYAAFYDFGETSERLGTLTTGNSKDILALQAADILAYEMQRHQRAERVERYPFTKLREACEQGRFRMTLAWGPLRYRKESFEAPLAFG